MNEQEINLLSTSKDLVNKKSQLWKQMKEIFSEIETHEEWVKSYKGILPRLKDYVHYKGRGWHDGNSLSKNIEKVKFPDRTTPTFRKLAEIITDCALSDNMDLLKEYFQDLKEFGIHITVDPIPAPIKNKELFWEKINQTSNLQTGICDIANVLRDEKAAESEEIDLVQKPDFKKILNLYIKKTTKDNADEPINKETVKILKVLEAVNKVKDV